MNDADGNSKEPAAHDWAGEAGTRWLAQLDRFESMIEPIGEALLARAAYVAGEKVVDIGCGGGWTTRRIAERTGNTGLALGLDISPELVAAATDRAQRAGLANIRFEQGDAATAMPEEAPFDRLHSRFGTMFFPDPYAAFANLRRMLRASGRLDIAVWAPIADNPWQRNVMAAIRRHIDLPTPQPREPGPFALGEQDYVTDLLRSAGFSNISFDAWTGVSARRRTRQRSRERAPASCSTACRSAISSGRAGTTRAWPFTAASSNCSSAIAMMKVFAWARKPGW